MPMAVKKVCQVIGFLLLLGVLFLVLSVISYAPDDPNSNHYVSNGSTMFRNHNIIVRTVLAVKARLADWALQAFGSAVALLASIAVIGVWYLLQGRLLTAGAVAWRGLLCLVAVSAYADLTFTSVRIRGTQFPAGGFGGKWLADSVVDCLSWGIARFAGGISGKWLADVSVAYFSRPGAYVVLGLVALGALCVGGKHPIRTALWRGLKAMGHGGWVLGRAVWQGLVGIGSGVRQGWVGVRHLSRVVTRLRQADAAQSSYVLQPEAYEHTVPDSTFPAAPPPGSREEETAVDSSVRSARRRHAPLERLLARIIEATSSVRSARQGQVPPAQSSEAARRKRQPVAATPASVKRPRQSYATDVLPSLDLLDTPSAPHREESMEELKAQARFLEQKLREFGVEGEVVQVLPGPVITMYEFAPAAGVKVSKIANLQDDLALVMRAVSVRVVAPIPGKAVVGIEIPHKRRETVRLRDLLDSEEWSASTSKLSLALGKDILGRPVITDLALIPHLLIAGATGSGKSVGLNSLICSLLFRATPDEVKMLMIDPKMLEFSVYDGIPHLLRSVVTNPKEAKVALHRVVEEMGRRYQLLAEQGVRSIAQYNQRIEEALVPAEKLPYLVVVIDELSDLMMVSAREVEDSLMRLAQMARAAGIHLIVATQRPSVDVLTGVIKANFPARLSFQVTSKVDSRTILDTNGAETLLGRGDMLFLAPGTSKPQRVHGAYVSEEEISRLVEDWKERQQSHYDDRFLAPVEDHVSSEEDEYDEKYDEAVALVTKIGQASISMLQRRLRVGYNRAARMIEMMEKDGIVGPADGIKPREVLVRNTFDDV
jgi:S-DNA-T family DNA segregation ATPase FtsK/SpoIIIE